MAGTSVYTSEGRKTWLELLPTNGRASISLLYTEYDRLSEVRRCAQKELVTESRRHPIARTLETCPGLGEIRVAVDFCPNLVRDVPRRQLVDDLALVALRHRFASMVALASSGS